MRINVFVKVLTFGLFIFGCASPTKNKTVNDKNSNNTNIKEVPWNEAPEWAKNVEFEMPKNLKVVQFKGNTQEQFDSYFISEDRILYSMCDCYSKNAYFETSKDECVEIMDAPSVYKKCVREVFEHRSLELGVDFSSFFECRVNSSIKIARYFDDNCLKINEDNVENTLVHLSNFENCKIDTETNLKLEKCNDFDMDSNDI